MEEQFKIDEANFKAKVQKNATEKRQKIEELIHYDNQRWTEKTMSQRYRLDYFKREKATLDDKNKND